MDKDAHKAAPPDVPGGLEQLSAMLKHLAPKVAPCVPSGTVSELTKLYEGEDVVAALDAVVRQNPSCSLCGGARTTPHWRLQWEVDVVKRRKVPSKCLLLCDLCEAVNDLPSLLSKLSQTRTDDVEISQLLQHFLTHNGHDMADAHVLQETIAVAYSMFLLYKELKLSPARRVSLEELVESSCGKVPVTQPLKASSQKAKRKRTSST